jgi:hypothetical protein
LKITFIKNKIVFGLNALGFDSRYCSSFNLSCCFAEVLTGKIRIIKQKMKKWVSG